MIIDILLFTKSLIIFKEIDLYSKSRLIVNVIFNTNCFDLFIWESILRKCCLIFCYCFINTNRGLSRILLEKEVLRITSDENCRAISVSFYMIAPLHDTTRAFIIKVNYYSILSCHTNRRINKDVN